MDIAKWAGMLASYGKMVFITALNGDFQQKVSSSSSSKHNYLRFAFFYNTNNNNLSFAQPFGNVAQVQAIADRICSLTAVCEHCKCGTCEAHLTVIRPDALKEIWKPIKGSNGNKNEQQGIYPSCSTSNSSINNRTSSSISSSKYCMPICRGCLTAYSNATTTSSSLF